jgi:hypothetical protein
MSFASRSYSKFRTLLRLDEMPIIDHYLRRWDHWASTGKEDPDFHLGQRYREFESALIKAFRNGDRRASSRFVCYRLLVGGATQPIETDIAIEFGKMTQQTCPVTTVGVKTGYFAGNLYHWWQRYSKDYPSMELLERLLRRPSKQFIFSLYPKTNFAGDDASVG